MKKTLKISSTIIPLLLIAGFLVYLRPVSLHGDTSYIIVVGHSMEPTMWTGDLAVVKRQQNYEVGDVIAFHAPRGQTVIHRIVGIGEKGFITQGDNKNNPDSWTATPDNIQGKSFIHIPKAGAYLYALRNPVPRIIFLTGLFVISSLLGVIFATKEWHGRKRQKERRKRSEQRRVERELGRWMPMPIARFVSRW